MPGKQFSRMLLPRFTLERKEAFKVSNITQRKMRLKKYIPNTWGAEERPLLPVNSSFRLTENDVSDRDA